MTHLSPHDRTAPPWSPCARCLAAGVVLAFTCAETIGLPAAVRADAGAAATADARIASSALTTAIDPALITPVPTRWLPARGRECRRGRVRGYCQGPRRVPEPHGPAAEVARRLELGELRTVSRLLLDPPPVEWVAAAPASDEIGLAWPVAEGRLWRGFGRPPRGSRFKRRHKGIDIGAPEGSLIRAARGGLVVYADNGIRGYGNLLVTVHSDGSVVFYAHCRALYLFPGEQVRRGQIVGEVGHTGRAIGAHVHFEYREQGRLRDPLRHFESRPELDTDQH